MVHNKGSSDKSNKKRHREHNGSSAKKKERRDEVSASSKHDPAVDRNSKDAEVQNSKDALFNVPRDPRVGPDTQRD